MILFHPATIGLIAWIIATLALIAVFAGRGISTAWSISSGVVRGVTGWSRRGEAEPPPGSPRAVELPPLPTVTAADPARVGHLINAGAGAQWRTPDAELEELPARRVG